MSLGPRSLRFGLCGSAFLLFALVGEALPVDARLEWERARQRTSVTEARGRIESLFTQNGDNEVAAKAGVWLGQLEYAIGRFEAAREYFHRAAGRAELATTRRQATFWLRQTESLLQVNPGGGADSPNPHVGTLLAEGDGLVRAKDPKKGVETYLSAEGSAREAGWLGPLAYRVSVVSRAAKDAKEDSELFDLDRVRDWERELRHSPERGLIVTELRGKETLSSKQGGSEFASRSADPRVETRQWGDEETTAQQELKRSDTEDERAEGASSTRRGPAEARLYVIQLGAYRDRAVARQKMEQLTARGLSVRLERGTDAGGARIFRIRLGTEQSREGAELLARRLLQGIEYSIVPVTS